MKHKTRAPASSAHSAPETYVIISDSESESDLDLNRAQNKTKIWPEATFGDTARDTASDVISISSDEDIPDDYGTNCIDLSDGDDRTMEKVKEVISTAMTFQGTMDKVRGVVTSALSNLPRTNAESTLSTPKSEAVEEGLDTTSASHLHEAPLNRTAEPSHSPKMEPEDGRFSRMSSPSGENGHHSHSPRLDVEAEAGRLRSPVYRAEETHIFKFLLKAAHSVKKERAILPETSDDAESIESDVPGLQQHGIDDTESEEFDEDFDYEADALLGGELEIASNRKWKAPPEVDYIDLMNKSYRSSMDRALRYQLEMAAQKKQHANLSSNLVRPRVKVPWGFTQEEMEVVFSQVEEYTRMLRPVDWNAVASEVFRFTGYKKSGQAYLEAFEYAIGQFSKAPRRSEPDLTTLHSKTSMVSLLRMQERRVKQQHVIKDMLLLKRTGQYDCATTFNYASGSVVDMAFKESTFKLAVANVTTQDIYNRQGNLLHCDLERGITKRLHGHWRQGEDPEQQLTYTVNDIKLSYSKDFFISGADDRRTMIWNAETGAHTSTFSDCQFKINRVAIMEDSVYHQDVFATCSSDGSIDIAALDETGQVAVRNRPLVVPGGRRGISSISFGYGHFWDCLAAGLEGLNNGLNNDGMQGQVAFYDANSLTRVAIGDLGFRHVASAPTSRSVSCLSFSSTGKHLVCGTSGRTIADDEQGDGIVRVFDVERAKVVQQAFSNHDDVNLVEFSPCERYIISCSLHNEVAVFDRRFLREPPLHRFHHFRGEDDDSNAGITSALWWPTSYLGPTQLMLMTGGGDGAVKLWDIRRATEDAEIWSFDANMGPIARMVSSRSFEHLVVGADTGAVSVFTLDHGLVSKYNNQPMALYTGDE